jgi:hypothetical protein
VRSGGGILTDACVRRSDGYTDEPLAALSTLERKKLVVFVVTVVVALILVLWTNATVHARTVGVAESAGTPLRAGLEQLLANPEECALTMIAGPESERPMRHANAPLIDLPDVLVLGQSDADHMSKTFFRDDVRFYNGFISNTCYAYQYEVFYDLVAAHGRPPRVVLLDVRSGLVLLDGPDPDWNAPPADPLWFGHPLFHVGNTQPSPWYRDVPSLLSLAQTIQTLGVLESELRRTAGIGNHGVSQTDTREPLRCVSKRVKSGSYRWLADGSRVYAGELDGILEHPSQVRIYEAIGQRRVNPERLRGLAFILGRMKDAGATVIVYSPPTNPRAYDDPKQVKVFEAFGAAIRGVTDKLDLDYCDLTLQADQIGCGVADFADEVHISRRCDQQIVRSLATGCAPRAGDKLKALLAPATLR